MSRANLVAYVVLTQMRKYEQLHPEEYYFIRHISRLKENTDVSFVHLNRDNG